ncbi:ATP-dependent protease [Novimethylophilus kurashikiensis]|uniref:ATP-dependent protease n=1 Tax=Novimethylophilus kurashikiensis TaxID=1825523 RepID=A0A2R5FC97_9PROT|nr:PcfJ domain-containing protein [Novimethylophilus kurashikiensis]GBG14264.1 ATP-dependent protease [Novimethylophilus kurashikiensis]
MNQDDIKIIPALQDFIQLQAEGLQFSSKKEKLVWRDFALALRALFRNYLANEKPRLFQVCVDGYIELYGGHFIRREGDGTVVGSVVPRRYVSSLGHHLVDLAYDSLLYVYREKVMETVFLKAESWGITLSYSARESISECWKWMVKNMPVALWSRKHGFRVEAKTVQKRIWDCNILDRAVFGLSIRIQGNSPTLSCYNACMINRVDVEARIKEAPNLASYLIRYCNRGEEVYAQSTVFQEARDEFIMAGGSAKGWRWLTKQGWGTVSRRFPRESWYHSAKLATDLADAQVGKVPVVLSLWHHSTSIFMPGLAKIVAETYKQRKAKASEMNHYVPLIFDFLRAECGKSLSVFKGATWKSLVRRQEEWHRKIQRERREKLRESGNQWAWAPVIQEVVSKSFVATSLNDTESLWDEGDSMGHCVGGYSEYCFKNRSRIYSIKSKEGVRVATLELKLQKSKWTIAQLYGQGNSRVTDQEVRQLATKVAKRCNAAELPKMENNVVLKGPQSMTHHQALTEVPFENFRAQNDDFMAMEIPF